MHSVTDCSLEDAVASILLPAHSAIPSPPPPPPAGSLIPSLYILYHSLLTPAWEDSCAAAAAAAILYYIGQWEMSVLMCVLLSLLLVCILTDVLLFKEHACK